MSYALVLFTDGIYHIASKNEIKKKVGSQASVSWNRTYYLADILSESDDVKSLINLKEQYKQKKASTGLCEKATVHEIQNSEKIFYSNEILDNNTDQSFNIIQESQLQPDNERSTWDELQCEIPDNEILNIEKENTVAFDSKRTNNKINIISVATISADSNKKTTTYKSKQQYCLFCNKLVNRFGRHITLVHKQEDDVKTIIALEKKSEQRKKLIDKLRRKSNYLYNHSLENSEKNIVARRPINKQCPKEYMDCPSCLMRISKVSLRRHVRKCGKTTLRSRTTIADSKRVTFDLHKIAHPVLREHVFPSMKNDECTQVLRKDYLAILYGNKLVSKYTSSHHYKMIRANLRYIGKYLIEMRKLSQNISDFKSCFAPSNYDCSVQAIRAVAGYSEEKGEFRAPYSASAIGTILKFCCAILESNYIKTNEVLKLPEVRNFLKLLQTELQTDINKTVQENLTALRRSKKVVLPTLSDMSLLTSYLRSKRNELFQEIRKKFSYRTWKQLASYTVVGIMVYNGRRPGEIERLTISDFSQTATSSGDNPELFQGNNSQPTNYTRCVLRGKLARNVSIVLIDEEVNCLKYIIEHREMAKINSKNPYVFGLPGDKPFEFLNAGILLKKFVDEAGVQYPERLFATNIRKNLGTKTTNLVLNPEEKEHSETIHKTIYRQPDMKKDISVMPKVLNFATGNQYSSTEDTPGSIDKQCTSNSEKDDLIGTDKENSTLGENNESCEMDASDDSEYNFLEYPNSQPKRKRRLIDMSLGYIPRKSWTTEERKAAKQIFKDEIEVGKSPSLNKCKNVIKQCNALQSRTPNQVKAWVSNKIKKRDEFSRGKGSSRKSWSTPEKEICRRIFGEDVDRGIYPNRKKIVEAIEKYPQLNQRTPDMVVAHLQHAIKKNRTSY